MAEQVLLRSAADLALTAERLSAEIAAGRAIDTGELGRISFSLRRTLASLGMASHAPGDEGPTLAGLFKDQA
jgi:hypothetical protein